MKVAVFQFATNAVGEVPAVVEYLIHLYLLNALDKAASLTTIDLTPPPREGEVVSLAMPHGPSDVREAAERAGADGSVWGELRFGPEDQPLIERVEVRMRVSLKGEEAAPRESRFLFRAFQGDSRYNRLQIDLAALEDLVEEMVVAAADAWGLDAGKLALYRVGEGLPRTDRAAIHFVYALRVAVDPESKLRYYRQSIAADPAFALAYTNAAQLLLGMGRSGEAMRLLLQAEANLKGSGSEPDILNLVGVTTLHMGMWEEAVKVWRRALELCPGHVEVLCNLATAYSMRERYEEAEECFREAIASREDYPLAWFLLGRLMARRGRHEEAERAMRRYIDLCPGDPWAYFILGTSLARLGRDDQARFALAKAAQLDPDGEAGALARHELQNL